MNILTEQHFTKRRGTVTAWLSGMHTGRIYIVNTTRNSALPLIMRAYASAAFSSG